MGEKVRSKKKSWRLGGKGINVSAEGVEAEFVIKRPH